jgi:hypothetical protein
MHFEFLNISYILPEYNVGSTEKVQPALQRANKCNKNRVGHIPTSEQNWKIILSDEVRCRIGKG